MTGIPTSVGDAYIFCTPLKGFYFSCYPELLELSKYRGGFSFLDYGWGGGRRKPNVDIFQSGLWKR